MIAAGRLRRRLQALDRFRRVEWADCPDHETAADGRCVCAAAERIRCGGREPWCIGCGMRHWPWAAHVRVRVSVFRFVPARQPIVWAWIADRPKALVLAVGASGSSDADAIRVAKKRLQRRLDRERYRWAAKSREDAARGAAGNAADVRGWRGYHSPHAGGAAAALDIMAPDYSAARNAAVRASGVYVAPLPDPFGIINDALPMPAAPPLEPEDVIRISKLLGARVSRTVADAGDPPGTARCADPFCSRYGRFAVFGGLDICPRAHVIGGPTGA